MKKTESMTFRLESEILDNLRQEAKRKDVTVNTLVSQIAKQHTQWHSMAAPAGFIYVRKQLIMNLLESQNDDAITSLAKHIALSSNKDFVQMLRKSYSILSALDMIETWLCVSGYPYNHSTKDLDFSTRLHSFIIQHHMGRKWSLYLSELYKNLFEGFGIRDALFDINDNTLAFEVVVPIQAQNIYRNNDLDYRWGIERDIS